MNRTSGVLAIIVGFVLTLVGLGSPVPAGQVGGQVYNPPTATSKAANSIICDTQASMTALNVANGTMASIGGQPYVYSTTSYLATVSSASSSAITTTASHGFFHGEGVIFTATVAGNLTSGAQYFIRKTGATTFEVYNSLRDALNYGTTTNRVTLAGTERGTFKPASCALMSESTVTAGTYWFWSGDPARVSVPDWAFTPNNTTTNVAKANLYEIENDWFYFNWWLPTSYGTANKTSFGGTIEYRFGGQVYIYDELTFQQTGAQGTNPSATYVDLRFNGTISPVTGKTWANKAVIRIVGHLNTYALRVQQTAITDNTSPYDGIVRTRGNTGDPTTGALVSTVTGGGADYYPHAEGYFTNAAFEDVAAENFTSYEGYYKNQYNTKCYVMEIVDLDTTVCDVSGAQSTTIITFQHPLFLMNGTAAGSGCVFLQGTEKEIQFLEPYFYCDGTNGEYCVAQPDNGTAASCSKVVFDGGRAEVGTNNVANAFAFLQYAVNVMTFRNINYTPNSDYFCICNGQTSNRNMRLKFIDLEMSGSSGRRNLVYVDGWTSIQSLYVDCPLVTGDSTADSSETNSATAGGLGYVTTTNNSHTLPVLNQTILNNNAGRPWHFQDDNLGTNHYHSNNKIDARQSNTFIAPIPYYAITWAIDGTAKIWPTDVPALVYEYNPSATTTIQKIEPPRFGIYRFRIYNNTGNNLTITHDGSAPTSANVHYTTIYCSSGANITVATGSSVEFQWIGNGADKTPLSSGTGGYWYAIAVPH